MLSEARDNMLLQDRNKWNVACTTEACAEFLKKLNPENDWVKDHLDSLDMEGESE